jgi:ATP-dependent helicase/nuclease subunit A
MSAERISDRAARERAIDPSRSFIVQAPAGSGKTGLLTQRYLRLLAGVDAPEEVLAITFTRKAAGEMRERIVDALARAGVDREPDDAHDAAIWRLARAARARDAELGWELSRHPARLRIQTIDSFNAALTRQMPLLSGFGAPPAIAGDAGALYTTAAERTIALLEDAGTPEWSDAIAAFLLHVDNRLDRAAGLLAGMLARREQWLRALFARMGGRLGATTPADRAAERAALEQAIADELRLHIGRVHEAIPESLCDELAALAAFAAGQLQDNARESPIAACAGLDALPEAVPEALAAWQGIAALLLTQGGIWRKGGGINVKLGFSTERRDEKTRMQALLGALAEEPELEAALARLRRLPQGRYDDDQWRLVEAFSDMLRLAVAELEVVFAERGEVDHAEIALRAVRALGDDENPTDLALALDHRIRHVLVDEFQDTSTSQYQLLAALTRGWSDGDGRSLFVVGDPMQSIYAFREAEVGLFMRARAEGIGALKLERLRLEVNFRSRATLVDWVNATFPRVLARTEDPGSGAVPFAKSSAFDAGTDGGVGIHPQIGADADAQLEAQAVAALARERLADTADGRLAILVRGRRQTAAILPALRAAGLRFQAVEIESLATRPVVQDLTALTRALVHDGDRAAWLAVLRAPWCGLTLADLYLIADDPASIPERLGDADLRARLSGDGRARLERVLAPLAVALAQRRRGTLRHRVEPTWHALGGPAAAGERAALDDAEAFLALLEATEQAADLDDINVLDEALATLHARPDPEGDERLQVMTIHKAKGLEFDTVILPGLHAGTRPDDPPLLRWMERPRLHGDAGLLLAPVRAVGAAEKDPLYALIESLEGEKQYHEQGRLLYVAATRAIRRLELFGFARVTDDDDGRPELAAPTSGSLLARLWPAVEGAFREALTRHVAPHKADGKASEAARLRRLTLDWSAPRAEDAVQWQGGIVELEPEETKVEYEWAGSTARIVGIVVHRFLQQMADDGLEHWTADRVTQRRAAIRAMLAGLGAGPETLDEAEQRSVRALLNVLGDENGRWILAAHQQAVNELALSSIGTDGPETRIIDRTFVDEHGTRWIIDYKTGYRAGGDIDGFLAQEAERYAPALARYASLMQAFEPGRAFRTALYFPLLGRLLTLADGDLHA